MGILGYPGSLAGPFQLEIGTATSQSAEVAAGVMPSIAVGTQQQTPHQPGPSTSLQASTPSAPAATGLKL